MCTESDEQREDTEGLGSITELTNTRTQRHEADSTAHDGLEAQSRQVHGVSAETAEGERRRSGSGGHGGEGGEEATVGGRAGGCTRLCAR